MSTIAIRPRAARTIDVIGVLAVVVGLLLGLVPGIAPSIANAAHTDLAPGAFEIDGNTAATGGTDWSTFGGPIATDEVDTASLVDTTWFKSSMVESTYPNWEFQNKGNKPSADLQHLYMHSQQSDAGSLLWLGATRVTGNGNAQVAVEFNKFLPPSEPTSHYRSEGDLYIVFNFPGTGGNGDGAVNVAISQWPEGADSGSYGAAAGLSTPTHYRYAMSADRTFIELELNLGAIFSGGLGIECSSFGGLSFRTEASSGEGSTDGDTTGGNDESTLKDITQSIPIDLDTCAEVTVEKVDAEGEPLNGATFAVFSGHGAASTGTPVATCVTGPDEDDLGGADTEDDGECSFGAMQPGNYTLHETGVPDGYRISPEIGTDGYDFTVAPNVPEPLGPFTDPRIDYTIEVEPDGRNAVGNDHTFTVTLTDDQDAAVAGADIDLTWSGDASDVTSVTPAGPDTEALDCTTDASGQCTVVVSSASAGSDTLTASWATPYQNASGDGGPSTDGAAVASITDAAAKTWVGYVASIEKSATNLVSNGDTAGEHVFTATVKEDDGSGSLTAASDVEVTVTWTGAPDDASISPSGLTCTTNASGQCTFTVDSPTAGAGTITIVGLDGTIEGLDDVTNPDEDIVYDVAVLGSEPVAEAGKSLTATKTWREYRALIDGDATNPVGEAHTFNVQVQYRHDDGANSWSDAEIAGLTVQWDSPSGDGIVGSVDLVASTCDNGTDADGRCTIVVDTDPDEPGSRSVELLSVTGDLLPGDEPNATDLTYAFDDGQYDATADEFRTTTKTWVEFGANIVSDGHNLVSTDGEPLLGLHEFTVTVWRQPAPGADSAPVPAGTKVTTSIDWDSDFPEPTDLVYENECLDDGTRSVALPDGGFASQCTITLNTTVPGVATVTPSGLVGYDYGDGNGSQAVNFADGNFDSAVKTWYRYRAWIDADSTNLAGDPEGDHDFTVTVEQDSGDGWGPVPNDTTVTVTSPDGSNDGSLDDASCTTTTTDDVSTCTIGVSSLAPGSRTVTVGTVQALDVDGDPVVDVSGGEYLDVEGQRTAATKNWVSYSATISADATNLTEQDHVFTVTAFVDSGDGPVAAPAGTTLTIDVDADFLVDNTCDDGTGDQLHPETGEAAAANECFVTVTSDDVDEVTVTVTHATPVSGSVDGDPTDDITDVAATKTWIDVSVSTGETATNLAGESHTFTVDVTVDAPGELAEWELDSVAVETATGGVGQIDSQTCDAPDDGAQSCTVTVSSNAPGDLQLLVTSVSFTYDGTSFSVDFDDESTEGEADVQDLDATKTWRAYEATLEADGLNLVRDEHTFTATVRYTEDGTTWTLADGADVVVGKVSGTGTVTDGECTTGATGTCTVTVNSDTAGTGTFEVTSITVVHPETGADETLGDGGTTDVAFDNDDTAAKTWAAFRGLLSADSVNVTGDDHVFDVLVEYTTGGDWVPVPDGSTVTFTDNGDDGGVGSVTDDTCDSTVAEDGDVLDERVCTITVDSDDSGPLTVTLLGVEAQISVGELTEDFDVTFPSATEDELSGVLDGFALADYSATKTWAAYTLSLDPVDAVNLLNGLDDDPERYHTITATLGSDDPTNAPVGGQTIDVTVGGDTGVIVAVDNNDDVDVDDPETFEGTVAADGLTATCTTAADGTCDIVIFSTTTGDAEVNASYDATVGDSEPVTVVADTDLESEGVQGATKTWTTYRVTVTPAQAVNLVENDHVFTVLVEKSTQDGLWLPVVGAVPTVSLTAPTATVVANTCPDGTVGDDAGTVDVNEAGTCLVTVSSDNVEAATLTATYQASQGQVTAAFTSDPGAKSWIDYALTVTPETADNLVDTDHVFTVTVTTTFPSLDEDEQPTTTTVPVVGAFPSISLGDGDVGSIIDNGCADGTDTDGTCEVTIRSSAPGSTTLTATYLGTAADDTEQRPYTDSGDKLWVDYRLTLGDDAVNAVGDAHTFTATLTRSEDGTADEDFLPVAGQTLTFSVEGVGSVTGGDVDDELTCTTDEAGQCDIVINSDEAGATTVDVAYDAVVGATRDTFDDEAVKQWVDITLVKTAVTSDGFSDGDLIADPQGFPFLAFSSGDQGPKTAVFEYEITNPSNVTLVDVVLTDDRLGTIDLSLFPDCQTLDPGETCFARASEQFDYDDATALLGGLITNIGTVTATGDGEEVSDTDDATITLVAVQSSILIDLLKEVVGGVGDVTIVDGRPTVNWSQEEYEAGVAKSVRYRFTVTNISNSPIIDVELIDPMISDQPLIAVSDGVTLQPDESRVVEVDHLLTVDQAFPDGPIASRIDNVATVTGANETRDSFSEDTDDASVFSEIVFAEVLEKQPPLPATGFLATGLTGLSFLLIAVGAAILWLDRRRFVLP